VAVTTEGRREIVGLGIGPILFRPINANSFAGGTSASNPMLPLVSLLASPGVGELLTETFRADRYPYWPRISAARHSGDVREMGQCGRAAVIAGRTRRFGEIIVACVSGFTITGGTRGVPLRSSKNGHQ
jgi:hypothetical protein